MSSRRNRRRVPPPCGSNPWGPPESWRCRIQATPISIRFMLGVFMLTAMYSLTQIIQGVAKSDLLHVLAALIFFTSSVFLAIFALVHPDQP